MQGVVGCVAVELACLIPSLGKDCGQSWGRGEGYCHAETILRIADI